LGIRVQDLGLKEQVKALGFRGLGSGFEIDSSRIRVKGLGLRAWGFGLRV
jgi:hypothetical protein